MVSNAVFVAATGQNVGKTTLCLGLIAALKRRYSSVGFLKPVGQQHLQIEEGINVDKDVFLFKEHFNLDSSWHDMSPVILPAGFTRDFLDQKIDDKALYAKIKTAFENISSKHPYTIVEGTGHVGVGSIVNLNNAQVAKFLGLDMVIIASGGLGSAFDELALNIHMCQEYGVKVRGVILNRVLEEKREMIMEYVPRALKKWGVPLLGCVPYNEFLSNPTIRDFETLFNAPLLSGDQHRYRHFQHTRLVACSLEAYESEMQYNELIITPATRVDIIRVILERHKRSLIVDNKDFEGGIILTSRHPPSDEIVHEIRQVDIPVIYAPLFSYDAMKKITSFIAKIRDKDVPKILKAIELVEANVCLDRLTGC